MDFLYNKNGFVGKLSIMVALIIAGVIFFSITSVIIRIFTSGIPFILGTWLIYKGAKNVKKFLFKKKYNRSTIYNAEVVNNKEDFTDKEANMKIIDVEYTEV